MYITSSARLGPGRALFDGIAFHHAKSPRIRETLQFSSSFLRSSPLCGSHGTTAVAHQALSFATATDGAPTVCACLCHGSLRTTVGNRNKHITLTAVQLRLGRHKKNPWDFTSSRAATWHTATTAAVQQRCYRRDTTAPALRALAFMTCDSHRTVEYRVWVYSPRLATGMLG